MNEQAKFWRLLEFGELELLRATYITHAFTPHFHEGFAIGVILCGAQEAEYRRSTQVMPEGTVCVLNPGEVHTAHAVNQYGWTYRMLYPDVEMLQQIASQIAEREQDVPFFPELVIDDNNLFSQVLRLHRTLERSDTSLLERESQLVETVGQLILRHADAKPTARSWKFYSKYTKKVREYLDQHYDEEISLKQLARLVELSPYYLLRLFRKEVGVTPYIYLTHRRIIIAKQLLTAGHSIAEVAYETGFVDQSHLTNRFKHIVGVTPRQYCLERKS